MSVIGPRPGLWNQDILTAERDKYNAIGGIITGLFLNYKIHFCRSLEFYMFENDISSGNSVSVINRYNSFFSSSQIGHQRYCMN